LDSDFRFEQNEAAWWSLWAEVTWLSGSVYRIKSEEFDEYFFNRVAIADCAGPLVSVPGEDVYAPRVLTIPEGCDGVIADVMKLGYAEFEAMHVLKLSAKPSFRLNPKLLVEVAGEDSGAEWSEGYRRAFYGDSVPVPGVARAVEKAVKAKDATLLIARSGGSAAGVLALFRTRDVAGIYCVGTLQAHRRQGVAGTLMAAACGMATEEGREVVLQTIASDKVDNFYLAGGFARAYSKAFLRPGPRKPEETN
jgi:GNAT superfamily N-acetyltransferase